MIENLKIMDHVWQKQVKVIWQSIHDTCESVKVFQNQLILIGDLHLFTVSQKSSVFRFSFQIQFSDSMLYKYTSLQLATI